MNLHTLQYYDIRKKCIGSHCYDFSGVEKFLNKYQVQKALGVRGIPFVSCSSVVYDYMSMDWMKNYDIALPPLLQEGIKLLVYDLICNWLGNWRWAEKMRWWGQKLFVAAPRRLFEVDGVKAWWRKSYGGQSFVVLHIAGHMVPMDQPRVSLEMMRRWFQGQSL